MNFILIIFRFPLVIFHVSAGLIILIFFPSKNINLKPIHHMISCIWMKILFKIFGFKLIKIGEVDLDAKSYISNHVTLFDIIVINSIIPVNFVAKSEIKNWPIIGHLSAKTGTIFINRGDSSDNERVIMTIQSYLKMNKKVVIFPEGRIGDGKTIRKFHSKLLKSVSDKDMKVQPIFIHYPKEYPSDNQNDQSICWSDKTQTLLKISLKCMSRWQTNVIVKFGNSINCNQSEYSLSKESFESVSNSRNELVGRD